MELVYGFCVLNLDGRVHGRSPVPSQSLLLYQLIDGVAHWPHHVLHSSPPLRHLPAVLPGPAIDPVLSLCMVSSEIRGSVPSSVFQWGWKETRTRLAPTADGGLTVWLDGAWERGMDEILRWSSRVQYFRRSFPGERQEGKKSPQKNSDWRCFLFYSVMTVIFSKQWNEKKQDREVGYSWSFIISQTLFGRLYPSIFFFFF